MSDPCDCFNCRLSRLVEDEIERKKTPLNYVLYGLFLVFQAGAAQPDSDIIIETSIVPTEKPDVVN